jgi:hypothetical protein
MENGTAKDTKVKPAMPYDNLSPVPSFDSVPRPQQLTQESKTGENYFSKRVRSSPAAVYTAQKYG